MLRNRVSIFFLVSTWIAISSLAGFSQDTRSGDPIARGTGAAGESIISGRVFNFNGQPAADARVELMSLSTGQVADTTYANNNGQFSFNSVTPAAYEVVATKGLVSARENVELSHAELPVSVNLRLPNATDDSAADAGTASAVSVAQMKVPEKARKAYRKAQKAMQASRTEEAAKAVAEALAIDPNYADALSLRGVLELDAKQTEQARADMEQAVGLDPHNGMNLIALGATYNVMTRFDDAYRVLRQGIALEPSAWQGYFELGKTMVAKGQYMDALAQLGRAGDLAPKSFAAIHLVKAHAYLSLRDYDQSMSELQQYLEQAPHSPQAAQVRDAMQRVRAFATITPGK